MDSHTVVDTQNAQPIASGLESKVYRVEVDKASSLILKRRLEQGKQNYPFEAYVYRQLIALGAHVPEAIFADEGVLLTSAFFGREMDDQEDLYQDQTLMTAIAQDLALCRRLDFQGFGEPIMQNGEFVGKEANWQEHLDIVKKIFNTRAIMDSGLTQDELQQLQNYWVAVQPTIILPKGRLVHGDFAMSAIFVKDRQFEGIIDFGDAFIGDPLLDLAHFRFKEITKPYGKDLYQSLLKHYGRIVGFAADDLFEQTIRFYMIYWALVRVSSCPDERFRMKFVEKTRYLCRMLSLL